MPSLQYRELGLTGLYYFFSHNIGISVGNEKENKGMQQEKESLPNRRIKSNNT